MVTTVITPSGDTIDLGGPLGLPLFLQMGRHPVFIHPKPTYRPIANWYDLCLRYEWTYWKAARPYFDCQMFWHPPLIDEEFADDTWATLPPDIVAFNPVKSVAVPLAAGGDQEIFEIHVPIGYDGIVLAHFHDVIFPAGGQFMEGSGDLAWRVSTNGRYLRDMGNMTTTRGQAQFFHPIAGGELVRSDSILRYIVAAPNVTGMLPAGGRVVAGLHGWFFPRGHS